MSSALYRTAAIVLLVGAVGFASQSSATTVRASCSVVGTWELTGVTVDGKAVTPLGQERKIVTARHYMWLYQDARRDTLPLKTRTDSLMYYRVLGGSGTYTVEGDSYVEHTDFFFDPAFLGKDWKATCRTEKDRWVHSYTRPGATPAAVVEDWRRLE
jgi:hypothetical protein